MQDVKALVKVTTDKINSAIGNLLLLDKFNSDDRKDWLEDWWPEICKHAKFWPLIHKKSGLATGVVLAIVHKRWPSQLPDEITEKYGGDFSKWAKEFSGLEYSSWAALMRIAQTFVLEWDQLPAEYKPAGPIEIPVRDAKGNEIFEGSPDGETEMVVTETEFDPWEVDHSKLRAARSAVQNGQADAELWEAIVDRNVTTQRVYDLATGTGTGRDKGKEKETKVFWNPNSELIARQGRVEVVIIGPEGLNVPLYYHWEGTRAQHELAKNVIDRMMAAAGTKMPESMV
jgi:hypothetical protein